MILNRFEHLLMNNPIRASIQRRYEGPLLHRMGGPMGGGRALEIGCGRGVGTEIVLNQFGAEHVDAFDLDPRMVDVARHRLRRFGDRVNLTVGDAETIDAPDGHYDAVFDFGIIHHVPRWRGAVEEVYRVLRPGGMFYGEEIYAALIDRPLGRLLFDHPREDRFDEERFLGALTDVGFEVVASRNLWGLGGWFVARRGESPH